MRSRTAVSAEVFGDWNKRQDFVAPCYPKSSEERTIVEKLITKSFLFNHLEASELTVVIDAIQPLVLAPDTDVIIEGEVGSFLCVVEEGSLVCLKGGVTVGNCKAGDVFGELALLYSAPRAATVRSQTDCKLWRLDSQTFTSIVRESSKRRRQKYSDFLRNVELLENATPYELSQIADALSPKEFAAGETIVSEGEPGDSFFIIERGSADAYKREDHVFNYSKPGDYFGELSLLHDEPRAATVRAGSDGCRVLVLERSAFVRLIGSMEYKLHQRNYN